MKKRLAGTIGSVVMAVLFLLCRPAFANNVDDARRHYAAGTKAFEIGAYDEAIREYGEAYRLIDDPALLFNLGQAHRLAGHTLEALRTYRMFLAKVPNTPNRVDVEQRIQDLQQQLDAQRKPEPTAPVQPAVPESVPAPTPPPTDTITAPRPPLAVVNLSARRKVIAGAVVMGVGAALAVTGIAFGVLAQNAGNELTHAAQTNQEFDYGRFSAGKTDQVVEIALLVAGSAAIVAGTAVLVVGNAAAKRSRMNASFVPFAARNLAGLAAEGRF